MKKWKTLRPKAWAEIKATYICREAEGADGIGRERERESHNVSVEGEGIHLKRRNSRESKGNSDGD